MIVSLALIGIGLALTWSPHLLGYAATHAAVFDHVTGTLAAAFAFLSLWEILGSFRRVCALIGLALLCAPFWIRDTIPSARVVHIIAGLLLVGLGLLAKRRTRNLGGGWSALWKREPARVGRITWS